ncbi:hypothetical protein MSG28_012714 [Choristoneura fumiferana]|uniref:Uncharacterized protein n=1 Tax=Choristoneura fumiferana TaxID=7141 RepID=A0ACC0JHU2_CHOFU|nr:hypothetical protein MSG28_012714 [Choristoneura fumiferana]
MAMVSEVKVNGAEPEAPVELPPALAERPAGLPPGKYSLVGWDMDTTGRRLIDEICQIAAYTPQQSYSQYIMPYGDLNPGARRRHNVRVVTVGRYRMLKDTNTHKSEISALTDFLDWLEKEKGDGSVILLLDRFKSIVAGFADSYALAADKCKATVKSVSLRVLARVLLDADSLARKRVTQLRRLLADAGLLYSQLQDAWTNHKLEGTPPLRALYTLRPRAPRKRVTQLRRLLADAGLLYSQLQDAWTNHKLEGTPPLRALYTLRPRAPREARHAAAAAAGRRRAALLAAAGRLDQPQAGRYAPTACSVHTAAARPEGSASRSCGGCWPTPGCSTRSCRTPGPTTSWKVRPHCVLCTHCGRAPRGKRVTQLRRLLADAGLLYSQLQDTWTNHKLEGKRVTQLRRLLADAGLLYSQLQDAWTNHKLEGTPHCVLCTHCAARPEGSASRSCGGCWPTPGCSTRSCRTPGPTTSWKVRPHCVLCTHCGRAPRGKRVTQLRRLLADAGLLYSQLQDAWTNHKLEGTPPLRALYTLRPRAPREARHAAAAAAGRRRAALLAAAGRLDQPQAGSTYNTVVENASRRYPVYQYGQYSDGSRRTILFSGLEKQMAALSVSAKEEDIKELIDIFDCHFDPAKEPKGPKPRTPRNRIRATSTGETGEAGEPEGSTSERKNRPRGDRKSQEMSMHLRQVLIAAIKTELYPRSQIDIYVEVLQVWAA